MAATYNLITSNTLSSTAASITFSSIPQTYTDLILKTSTRNNDAGWTGVYLITLNNDTATNYSTTYYYGEGSNALSGADLSVSNFNEMRGTGNGATASTYCNFELYLANYTTTSNKILYSTLTTEGNSTSNVMVMGVANLYEGSSGISSITIANQSSLVFSTDSSFYLYGIKNS